MTTFAIGDVHGCYQTLTALIDKLPEDSKYLFIGDIVNRGPESLKTIRSIMRMGKKARCLLGNHDLHLLAVYAGKRPCGKGDTIDEILQAPDCDEIIDWLRSRKMADFREGFLCVHAATYWSWSVEQTLSEAKKVQKFLRADDWKDRIGALFGHAQWHPKLKGDERLQAIVNVLTRTRYLHKDGSMEFKQKLSPAETPPEFIPWFAYPGRATEHTPVAFGHWSTLGSTDVPNAYPLDGACLWGGALRALALAELPFYIEERSEGYCSPW